MIDFSPVERIGHLLKAIFVKNDSLEPLVTIVKFLTDILGMFKHPKRALDTALECALLYDAWNA